MNISRYPFIISFLRYGLAFFVVVAIYDFAFESTVYWFKDIVSGIVFGLLMAYFRHRGKG
jgi:hypothetical protein